MRPDDSWSPECAYLGRCFTRPPCFVNLVCVFYFVKYISESILTREQVWRETLLSLPGRSVGRSVGLFVLFMRSPVRRYEPEKKISLRQFERLGNEGCGSIKYAPLLPPPPPPRT